MIETIVSEYLQQRVKEKVYMEVPEKPPERYVIIEKTGGSKENHICYRPWQFSRQQKACTRRLY